MEKLNSIEFSVIISLAILLSPFILKRWQSISGLKGLVTTFGIFGTFIGIFLGLLAFDVTNIQGSVPKLLSGLQTAFLTSIAGMFAGILLTIAPKTLRHYNSRRGQIAGRTCKTNGKTPCQHGQKFNW
jgi:hypothetical protein